MGTKKGMVRKTARRAYTKKAKSGSIASMAKRAGQFGKKKSGKYLNQDAKKGKKVKKARNSARMNRLEELGRIDAEKKNKNRMAEKRRVVRELNAKKGKKVVKKAGYGMKKAKSGLKKPSASQKGLKKLPTAVRNKMGYAKKGTKKGMVRKTARKAYMAKSGTKKGMVRKTARKAYMKKGGSTRKCRSGCK